MAKKFTLVFLVILLIAGITAAEEYWIHYPGLAFIYANEEYDGGNTSNSQWDARDTSGGELFTYMDYPHYVCPVNWVHNHKWIKMMTVRFFEKSSSGNLRVRLWCRDFETGEATILAEFDTSGLGRFHEWRNWTVLTKVEHKINTYQYTYWIDAHFDADYPGNPRWPHEIGLGMVRIQYGDAEKTP